MVRQVIAFIGARKGSKRLPGKNTQIVGGKPLICHTIDHALSANCFDSIYVNTDDHRIIEIAEAYNEPKIICYTRPSRLGQSDVFVVDVIREMLNTLKIENSTTVGVMFPTVPLRNVQDIINAKNLFEDRDHPVVSCTKLDFPVHLALRVESETLSPIFPKHYKTSTRHDDQEVFYRANFAIIFNRAGVFREQVNLIGQDPIPYFMPPERSIDIDNQFQMNLVEFFFKGRQE